ncbi:hypothetical protein FSP39_004161 [Pinctada imbricata]|uniref:NADH dehydrogenase [ubiquinone] 1 beta subcomplex subunit 7 n=1 Tax=Pinctada imbricata TaxID=66713 RepID=A0AA88XNY3_PINIB|nr:hypothetical protein FSP39_004161 [Pinctada imbricata]
MHPEARVDDFSPEKFDPNLGFKGERKMREPPVSADILNNTQIPYRYRDYCVGHYIEMKKCLADNIPFINRCSDLRHEYSLCQYEDQVKRMKEYEREKRILLRNSRKETPVNEDLSDME